MPENAQERCATPLAIISIAAATHGVELLIIPNAAIAGMQPAAAPRIGMTPMVAAGFLVCAAMVALLSYAPTVLNRRLLRVLAGLVIAVAAAAIARYTFSLDLLSARLPSLASPQGIPPNSALCFLLVGGALLMVESPNLRIRRAADVCAAVVCVVALAAVLGYLFEVTALYQVATSARMTLQNAFGFLLLAAAVFLVRPEDGMFAFLVGDDAGAVVARRLLPATITVLLWLAGLLSMGAHLELYSSRFAASLLVLAAMLVLTVLIGYSAYLMRRLDLARRSAEQELRRKERWFSTTLRSIGEAVIATDASGRVLLLNRMAEEITGWREQEAAGKPVSEVFRIIDENTGGALESPIVEVLRSGKPQATGKRAAVVARDGRPIPVDDGAAPIRDPEGKVMGVVLVFRDVTIRRQTEEALRISEKLAATGRLAASIAHEINNPLQAVTTILYLMQTRGGLDGAAREYLDAAQQELSRVSHITKHTLRFYHEPTSRSQVRVSDLLEEVLMLYAGRIEKERIRVHKRFGTAGEIEGFEGELRQIFSNLLVNALDAVGRDGEVVLHVMSGRNWKTSEHGVRVVVADNGRGIAPELRQQLFRPFFTTKGDRGTGLGLWVSAGIADRHQGCIRVYSSTRPGRSGTCFVVWLPAPAVVCARAAG